MGYNLILTRSMALHKALGAPHLPLLLSPFRFPLSFLHLLSIFPFTPFLCLPSFIPDVLPAVFRALSLSHSLFISFLSISDGTFDQTDRSAALTKGLEKL